MDPDLQADIAALGTTLTTVERVLDVDGLRGRIEKLEHEASDPNLWNDQAHAQKVTSELSHAQGELRRVEELRQRLDDLPVLYEMAAEEDGAGAADALSEAQTELSSLHEDIAAMEVRTLLGGLDTAGTTFENYDAETGHPLWAPQFISWNMLALELIELLD